MQELLPQPQQQPIFDKSSSKSTQARHPLEEITPPPRSDHQQSPLPSQEPRRAALPLPIPAAEPGRAMDVLSLGTDTTWFGSCPDKQGGRARFPPPFQPLTLFLQHLVGLQDLHLVRQPQRPAVHQLQDLGLHFLWRPAAKILEERRGGLKPIRAATSLARSPPPLPQGEVSEAVPNGAGTKRKQAGTLTRPLQHVLSASTTGRWEKLALGLKTANAPPKEIVLVLMTSSRAA